MSRQSRATYAHLAGDGRCCAKAKSTGERCKKAAVAGRVVCEMHGGKSPSGQEHGRWKHGRYSKYLPERLAERFEQSLQDPTLLELRAEIALLDARLFDLLEKVDDAQGPGTWARLEKLANDLRSTDDVQRGRAIMWRIVNTIEENAQRAGAWSEVYDLIDRRRKLVESENRHIRDQEQFVTDQQLMAFVGAILVIIREEVRDPDSRRAIAGGIDKLLHSPT